MGYMHISNLNKDDRILLFKQCWATEKVHGTSAHVAWDTGLKKITYFSGGAGQEAFEKLFGPDFEERFMALVGENGQDVPVAVYGEAYGGKMQGMSQTYGKRLRFIVFEVKVGDSWLDFETVRGIAADLGQDVVPGKVVDCTEEALTAYRNAPSEVAVLCGCGENTDRFGNCPPLREGIVLRPLVEMRTNGGRVIAKYKNPQFAERQSKLDAAFRLQMKEEDRQALDALLDEWDTEERLAHVLDALCLTVPQMSDLEAVIPAVGADIRRESGDELAGNKDFWKSLGGHVVRTFRKHIGVL